MRSKSFEFDRTAWDSFNYYTKLKNMVEISKIMSITNSINFTLITRDGFPISKKKKKKTVTFVVYQFSTSEGSIHCFVLYFQSKICFSQSRDRWFLFYYFFLIKHHRLQFNGHFLSIIYCRIYSISVLYSKLLFFYYRIPSFKPKKPLLSTTNQVLPEITFFFITYPFLSLETFSSHYTLLLAQATLYIILYINFLT